MRFVYYFFFSWVMALAYAGIVGAFLDYHETIAFMGTSIFNEWVFILVYLVFFVELYRWINS